MCGIDEDKLSNYIDELIDVGVIARDDDGIARNNGSLQTDRQTRQTDRQTAKFEENSEEKYLSGVNTPEPRLGDSAPTPVKAGSVDNGNAFIEVLQEINSKLGTAFDPCEPANSFFLKAALTKGIPKQDLIDVAVVKAFQWRKEPKMLPSLRPMTFFDPMRLPGYLNEVLMARKKLEMMEQVFGEGNVVNE